MKESNSWNPNKYNKHADFVSTLALPVVDLLAPKKSENILDVGCGDGTLACEIQKNGVNVIGIDSSAQMVASAKEKGINAQIMSVTELSFENSFNAIFSNAVLHWVKENEKAVENIHTALKKNGRFVAEFGGQGNVKTIFDAIQKVFNLHKEFGVFENPWYFPDDVEYKKLLESNGFFVEYIELIPRPTPIDDIDNWLDLFANGITEHLSSGEISLFKEEVCTIVKEKLYDEQNGWHVDYVRLRVRAIKV